MTTMYLKAQVLHNPRQHTKPLRMKTWSEKRFATSAERSNKFLNFKEQGEQVPEQIELKHAPTPMGGA